MTDTAPFGQQPTTATPPEELRRMLGRLWRAVKPKRSQVKNLTGNQTMLESDAGALLLSGDAVGVTYTFPNDLARNWQIEITQDGAGQVTCTPALGATMNVAGANARTRAQFSTIRVTCKSNVDGQSAVFNCEWDFG